MEHRWGRRIAVDVPIRLSLPLFSAKRGRLTNVSLSGGFITTNVDLRVLSRLQVVFEGPRRTRKDAVTVAAYVARKGDHGLGVEWCEFAPAAVAELIRQTTERQLHGNRIAGEPLPDIRIAASAGGRVKHGSGA